MTKLYLTLIFVLLFLSAGLTIISGYFNPHVYEPNLNISQTAWIEFRQEQLDPSGSEFCGLSQRYYGWPVSFYLSSYFGCSDHVEHHYWNPVAFVVDCVLIFAGLIVVFKLGLMIRSRFRKPPLWPE